MLRQKLIWTIKAYGGVICPAVLLVGLCMVFLLPLYGRTENYIDENAIGHRGQHVAISVNMNDFATSTTFESPSRLVRGHRSPGTEVIAVYVNTEYNASIRLANIVSASLRQDNNLGCDVQFFFVDNDEELPIPQSYARAAIVLNLSTIDSDDMCLDIYGKHGLQPNRDLVNTILHHTVRTRLRVSMLCQTNMWYRHANLPYLQYYLASLVEAIRLPLYPQRWHEIPTRGISTVAISSNPEHTYKGYHDMSRSRDSQRGASPADEQYVRLLLETIFSLNGLEERFHHASYVYIYADSFSSVPFEVAQFALIAFIATLMSAGYACYQLEGFNFSPLVALGLCVATPLASAVHGACGLPGVAALSTALVVAFSRARWNTTWISINAAAIGLMEALQPATGLLGGAGVACQTIFLHPAVASSPLILLLGSCLAWAIWAVFLTHVGLPIWSMSGISVGFVSLLIYPNAIWVASRLVRCIVARRKVRAAMRAAQATTKKSN